MNDQQFQAQSIKNKQSRWLQLIEQWQKSGKSQAQFCRDSGLNTNTFQYWKKKLTPKEVRHALIPVSIIPSKEVKAEAPHCGISLKLEGNLLLYFEKDFCSTTLLRLVETLRTR